MTNIQSLEDAVVALLVVVLNPTDYPTVAVAPLPSMRAEYENLTTGQQVWASFHGIKGGTEMSAESLYQETTYQFGIVIKARKLRDDVGIYNLIDLCNVALLGKRPIDGGGWLKLGKWDVQGEENGVFTCLGILECPGIPLFEQFDRDALNGANLVQLTHVEN